MATANNRTHDRLSFGPFNLGINERLLTRDGIPVKLGARALDILIALVSNASEIVSKTDLIACAWPDVFVEEGSLRFHINALRKALADGQDGARYIATLPGRGYCFVASVSHSIDGAQAGVAPLSDTHFLPARLVHMVGRTQNVLPLSDRLITSRFVTIVGAGGVGKTTAAIAVGHELVQAFAGAVLFVDLGASTDPGFVVTSLASILGLSSPVDNPIARVTAYLRDKRLLLILDNCEHLIDATADLAARIFEAAPHVHILATSRERLRVDGEHVFRLEPLALPPEESEHTAAQIEMFPATQLFVQRARAAGAVFDLSGMNAAIVADICRKLDGLPLSIELAAGRVASYGLQRTAVLLDQQINSEWQGQRNAPARQRTLRATLDWSYSLLSETERIVLRRLAVFIGQFTIEAALAIVTCPTIAEGLLFDAIDGLVMKSMVAARPVGAMMRYRLMDTTRAYMREFGTEDRGLADVSARHAVYYRGWLQETGSEWAALSNAAERAPHLTGIGNVRAALEWCFGADGNAKIGIELATAAMPVFTAMSLYAECHRWSEQAIGALDETTRGSSEEMHLQAALGISLILTRGSNESARMAIDRSAAIAEKRGNALDQLRLLGPLNSFYLRIGDLESALHYAKQSLAIARAIGDPAAITAARARVGHSLHHQGNLNDARVEIEAVLTDERFDHPALPGRTYMERGQATLIHHAVLARTLWLQGYPVQALQRLTQILEGAATTSRPEVLSAVLTIAVTTFFLAGDLDRAEQYTNQAISLAKSHSLGPLLATGHGFQGELAVCRGDAAGGIKSLHFCLEELSAARFELASAPFRIALARGYAALGQLDKSIGLLDETIRQVDAQGNLVEMPELLHVKGFLLSKQRTRIAEAETCFKRSLEVSRNQDALSWELRTATALAGIWRQQGRIDDAFGTLESVYNRFTEGFDTSDLRAAKQLLNELS